MINYNMTLSHNLKIKREEILKDCSYKTTPSKEANLKKFYCRIPVPNEYLKSDMGTYFMTFIDAEVNDRIYLPFSKQILVYVLGGIKNKVTQKFHNDLPSYNTLQEMINSSNIKNRENNIWVISPYVWKYIKEECYEEVIEEGTSTTLLGYPVKLSLLIESSKLDYNIVFGDFSNIEVDIDKAELVKEEPNIKKTINYINNEVSPISKSERIKYYKNYLKTCTVFKLLILCNFKLKRCPKNCFIFAKAINKLLD